VHFTTNLMGEAGEWAPLTPTVPDH
jgi:hypothetical protein